MKQMYKKDSCTWIFPAAFFSNCEKLGRAQMLRKGLLSNY